MTDKESKDFSDKNCNFLITYKNQGKAIDYKHIMDDMMKNKDILLQVRIDKKYDNKIAILEKYLEKNRSEVIRMAVDNLFDNILEDKKVCKNDKELKMQKIKEEVVMLTGLLRKIYERNDIEQYLKALKIKLDILEEESKK